MADLAFQIPGESGTEVVVRRAFWSTTMLKDGVPLPREGGRLSPYLLSMPDGTQHKLRLRGSFNLAINVDGRNYRLERPLRGWEYFFVVFPLIVAIPGFTGGALGFGLGFGAALTNARLARLASRASVRIASMAGVGVGVVAIYLLAAVALSNALHLGGRTLVVGACYEGSPTASTEADLREVSCTAAHDAEVFGSAAYPATSSTYPGQAALDAFANATCPGVFVTYTGRSINSATEGGAFFEPSSTSWAAGGRTVDCVATAPAGQKLTGPLARPGSGSAAP